MIALRPIHQHVKGSISIIVKEGRTIPPWAVEHLDIDALIKAGAVKDNPPKMKTEVKPKADKKSDG